MPARSKKGAPKGKRPKSGKGQNKEELEDPVVAGLRKIIDEMRVQNVELQESTAHYKGKLHQIVQCIVESNVDDFVLQKDLPYIDLPEATITGMIRSLTAHPGSALRTCQLKLDDLEVRINQLNSELIKMVSLKLRLQDGLKKMEKLQTVEDLHIQGKRLWYESCSTEVFVTPKEVNQSFDDLRTPSVSEVIPRPLSAIPNLKVYPPSDNIETTIPEVYLQVLNPRARSIDLSSCSDDESLMEDPPSQRFSGETHIFEMHKGLRTIIIKHLSKLKGNGADWRMVAIRVGIPDYLVQQWIRMRAPNAMALVLKVWGDCTGATVRMLHRHLSSPQLQSVVLAKRISDFYDVD